MVNDLPKLDVTPLRVLGWLPVGGRSRTVSRGMRSVEHGHDGIPLRFVDNFDNRVKVWIDQDLCTGDGICTDHAPEVFTILSDGIAYCKEGTKVFNDPGGAAELAVVPRKSEVEVVAAANECPGECIFIEFEAAPLLAEPGNEEVRELADNG